nr:two-component regulator propeller domain-containing protein [uncultured Flavobacterium sp.]
MKVRLTFLLLLVCSFGFAQNTQWGSYFSYTSVVAMAQNSSRMYAASDAAVFSQNTSSGELSTITSIEGLKADDITAIHYSSATRRTLVGNSTGLLLVLNNDGSVVTKIDIVQETNITYNKKAIKNIYEYNGIAYLSCDFGIATFNINTLQFGDTYFIGTSGGEVTVYQCAVHEGYLYAATEDGLKRALLTSSNLIDYNVWMEVLPYARRSVLSFNGKLYCGAGWNNMVVFNNNNPVDFGNVQGMVLDLREANNYMVVTTASKVTVYNSNHVQQFEINTVGEPAVFTCATLVGNKVYVGTTEKGVFAININTFQTENITPNGPLRSNIYGLGKSANSLWAVYGYADTNYDPKGREYGVSRFTSQLGWTNIPYQTLSTINGINKPFRDILKVTINPNNEKEVYLMSSFDGMLKLTDMVPTMLYDETNSGLENQQLVVEGNYRSLRVQAGVFDKQGALWVMNGLTEKPLKKLSGTSWSSYSFESVYTAPKSMQYGGIVIDDLGTKWIATGNVTGLVGYNETLNKFMRFSGDDYLPSNTVSCVALDKSGRLWIGTTRGLRVIYSTSRFADEDMLNTSSIVFVDDTGVAQELMYAQAVTDIEVDGSNNKWIGTGAGAFLVSPDGQTTLQHFTKENSPLPSSVINDIAIDNVTGEVFFATPKGMVSYKGNSTQASNDLNKVYVYPNPVRPNYSGDVKITNLTDKAVVKITDIEGNLVYEATSEGGTITWDTTAFGKYKVRTGVYMVFISSDDTTMTATRKVMVIRGN